MEVIWQFQQSHVVSLKILGNMVQTTWEKHGAYMDKAEIPQISKSRAGYAGNSSS